MNNHKHKNCITQKAILSIIKFSTSSENISSNGGFSFVSGILDSLPEMSLGDRLLAVHCNTRFSHQGIVRGAIGLMTAGCCDFADIEKFSGDAMFRHLVGKDIPSQETFRQRMNQLSETSWTQDVDGIAATILRKASLGRISMYGTDYLPLDIDVSVLEDRSSNKEGVAMSYHKVKGYAPIFCYAGTQGYMVADEMRPGSQHSESLVKHANATLLKVSRCFPYFDALRRVEAICRATAFTQPLFTSEIHKTSCTWADYALSMSKNT